MISFPPLNSDKGCPMLGQNRQFQWFNNACYIYPMVPASAASLLKSKGYEVIWADYIAEEKRYNDFIDLITKEKPDLIMMETKTPVVKQHWKIVDDLKTKFPEIVLVLVGDHVTALPKETMENSKVDFVLTGGDYDFLLLNLCDILSKDGSHMCHLSPNLCNQLEAGIWYREGTNIKSTGVFDLHHDLNILPMIDRDLTKWHLYSEKNGNYKKTPGTYTMAGRDCWYHKCTFCLLPGTIITALEGPIAVENIIENASNRKFEVLSHTGKFRKVTKTFKREYKGEIVVVEPCNLKQKLSLTPNHKVLVLKREDVKRCSKRSCWQYLCLTDRSSKWIKCSTCDKKYYSKYSAKYVEASCLLPGDFIVAPIITEEKDLEYINIKEYFEKNPCSVDRDNRISGKIVDSIINCYKSNYSQREISRRLCINRITVKRYIDMYNSKTLEEVKNPFIESELGVKFEKGKKWICKDIPVTKDFMRFVGYYLAEGHITKFKNRPNSYQMVLTFSEKEKEYIEDVVRISKEIFKTIDVRLHRNKANHTVQIGINNPMLAQVFKNLFGFNSYNKRLPENFIFLPIVKQKELIRGLFRGDGHLRLRQKGKGGSEYIYETVSQVLAQQVLTILHRHNLIPTFRECKPGKKGKVNKFSISLFHYDIKKIFSDLSLPERSSVYKHGFILDNYVFMPIKRIERKKYNGFVYNLEVEKDHSYAANNLIVSNCSWTTIYPKFRVADPDKLLNEIGVLIEKYQVKEIMDDTGCFPKGEWLKKFCEGMISRGYNKKVIIDCNMRFGALSFEEYKLMKKAGFRLVLFGLESANPKTLKKVCKGVAAEDIAESCKLARKAGLFPHITIMFGYPWENFEDIMNTVNLGKYLMRKGYAYTLQSTIVIPYPGTPLFDECKKEGLLNTLDWDRYDMREQVMKSEVPSEKIAEAVRSVYRVAFNLEFILRKIFAIRGWSDIMYFIRAVKHVIGHLVDFKGKK